MLTNDPLISPIWDLIMSVRIHQNLIELTTSITSCLISHTSFFTVPTSIIVEVVLLKTLLINKSDG